MPHPGPLQIMFSGTGSDVGKSVIAGGFCRILYKRGYKVAPFKAQNMALNSFVTMDGREMGRAQVFQATAAGLLPDADMNPVLLKPSGNCTIQVIVQGRVFRNDEYRHDTYRNDTYRTDTAEGYYSVKDIIFERVLESYNRLRNIYDALVLEGAGSLTEINLRKSDIVNMEMAKKAGAPVIIIADIERGGVFASIIGTMKLLRRKEKNLVIGFIINKFRGSISLFSEGIRMIEKMTKKPVFGVVPYFHDIHLPEEDSVPLCSGKKGNVIMDSEVKIAVIHLPFISNYTDFDPFELEEGVSIWYAHTPEELANCSIVIIPGTKNTIEDLLWLKKRGFVPAVENLVHKGKTIIGICGGYQMLGMTIEDPFGVESDKKKIKGLGFLPGHTVLEKEKKLSQVSGFCSIEGINSTDGIKAAVEGYEIHMGTTKTEPGTRPAFVIKQKNSTPVEYCDGAVSSDGLIWGTYLHGLFENDGFRTQFLHLHGRKTTTQFSYRSYLDTQLDRLAQLIEKNVDVERILRIAERYR
jgi:adenosylcobyric acid synthase